MWKTIYSLAVRKEAFTQSFNTGIKKSKVLFEVFKSNIKSNTELKNKLALTDQIQSGIQNMLSHGHFCYQILL